MTGLTWRIIGKINNKKPTHKCIFKISKLFNLGLKMLTEPGETTLTCSQAIFPNKPL